MEQTQANATSNKLTPRLMTHENYVSHYGKLQLMHSFGVTTTLKRDLSFEQSTWLASYINGNSKLRTEAKANGNEFIVSLFYANE